MCVCVCAYVIISEIQLKYKLDSLSLCYWALKKQFSFWELNLDSLLLKWLFCSAFIRHQIVCWERKSSATARAHTQWRFKLVWLFVFAFAIHSLIFLPSLRIPAHIIRTHSITLIQFNRIETNAERFFFLLFSSLSHSSFSLHHFLVGHLQYLLAWFCSSVESGVVKMTIILIKDTRETLWSVWNPEQTNAPGTCVAICEVNESTGISRRSVSISRSESRYRSFTPFRWD